MEFKTTPLTDLIAKNFSWRLWTNLPRIEFFEIARRNDAETNPHVCHSHDVCDANAYMMEAFEYVTGEALDHQDSRHIQIVDTAWDTAKASWKRKKPEWVEAIEGLLNCPDLSLDELEPKTLSVMAKATRLVHRWNQGEFENEKE